MKKSFKNLVLKLGVPFLIFSSGKMLAQTALDLGGTANRVETVANFDVTNGFTVEYDVYLNTLQNYNGLVTKGCSNVGSPLDVYITGGGTMVVYYGNCSITGGGGTAYTFSATTWYHIAHTYDPITGQGLLYVNDSLVNIWTVGSGVGNGTGPMMIGNRADGATDANAKFDNVRVWSGARTKAEILAYEHICLNGNETDLEVLYNMEEGAGTLLHDLATSNGAQNGNIIGSVIWNAGIACGPPLGAALNFDGVDDYVANTSAPNIPAMNAFTIESWVNINNTNNAKIFSSNELEFAIVNGHMELWSPSFGADNSTSIAIGSWQHLAVAYDGFTMRFYINGVLDYTASVSGVVAANTGYKLGKHVAAACCYLDGSLDEFKLWNRALCQGELQNNMNGELQTGQTGLVVYYQFNEGIDDSSNTSVITLTDTSENNNYGTLNNFALSGNTSNWIAPGAVVNGSFASVFAGANIAVIGDSSICAGVTTTLTASGASSYTWALGPNTASYAITPTATTTYSVIGADGSGCISNMVITTVTVSNCIAGAALSFDGINDYVAPTLSTNIPIENSPYTIEAWIQPNSSGASSALGIAGWGNYGSGNQVNAFRTTGQGGLDNYWWGNDLVIAPNGFNLFDGNWHHVAATFDGTTRTIYVDGIVRGFDMPSGHNIPNVNNFAIGVTNNYSEYFYGGLDEVRIWNIARTQCEIFNSMNAELTGVQTGLALYYKFNEGVANANNVAIITDVDSSGNGNNGALTNFALSGAISNWIAPGGVVTGSTTLSTSSPTISITGDSVICIGTTTTLSASGVTNYTWSTSDITASINVTPTVTTTYSVTGSDGTGCISNTAVTTITVNTLPTITTNTATICAGATATLTASGASTYIWSTNETTASINPSPSITTNYTVTGTDVNSCSNIYTLNVTVNPLPNINVNSAVICIGDTVTLTASGANTYSWSTNETTTSINVSPSLTATYLISGTDTNNCTFTTIAGVTVNDLPIIIVNSEVICVGTTATLTANGANTYTWSTSETTASISPSPSVTTNYTVTGTDVNNCSGIDTVSVIVNILPIITIAPSTQTICAGSPATLIASGATSYTWSTLATTASISATPTITSTYTVTGIDANNCEGLSMATITVNECTLGEKYISNDMDISIYPNPNKGVFAITGTTLIKNTMLAIYNSIGQEVYATQLNKEVEILSTNLSPGFYTIRLQNIQGVNTRRIVITE